MSEYRTGDPVCNCRDSVTAGKAPCPIHAPPVAVSKEPGLWVSDNGRTALEVALDLAALDDPTGVIGDAIDLLATWQPDTHPSESKGAREALEEIREIICDPTSNCYPELNLGHQMEVNDIICKALASQPAATLDQVFLDDMRDIEYKVQQPQPADGCEGLREALQEVIDTYNRSSEGTGNVLRVGYQMKEIALTALASQEPSTTLTGRLHQ